MTVTTVQGDTWDTIAQRIYGNTLRTQNLMEAKENIQLLDFQVFPAGIEVTAPEVEESTLTDDLPEWRK
ncbi:MAG: tail protein X [Prevotella sp.]|nr:tail protein X [Prevotella sp.]